MSGDGARSDTAPDNASHFGFRDVRPGEKQGLVDEVFTSVARRYDVMNDLMSAGFHRAWKAHAVTMLGAPAADRPFAHLDVAGGTGDIAFRVIEGAGRSTYSTVCDINKDMLAVGRERAETRGLADRVTFIEGNAEELPFPDASFDAYSIAFGIRNVPQIDKALREAKRVLKRGGRFLCLEFSAVDLPGLDRIYETYSFNVIPEIGRLVTGDRDSYAYLVESIRKFPKPAVFAEMIREAGLSRVEVTPLSGGIVAIHAGWKL